MKKVLSFVLAVSITAVSFASKSGKSKSSAPAAVVTVEQHVAASSVKGELNQLPSLEEKVLQNVNVSNLKDLSKLDKKALKKEVKSLKKEAKNASSGKTQLIALILVLLVGSLGIHRFYLGYTLIGVIQLLTLGGCGIWALIDLIRIIMGNLKPMDGDYSEKL